MTTTSLRYLLVLSCALYTTFAVAQQLTVIDLRYRSAEELLPALRPLLSPDAAITAADYKLLVRASTADIVRLREALAVLDRPAKQLLISVRYDSRTQLERETADVDGRIATNGSQLKLRTADDKRNDATGNISSVRVQEGQAAFIASGERVPIVSAVILRPNAAGATPNAAVRALIQERELRSGFQVQPRVNNDRVFLDITAQQQRLNDGNRVAVQNVSTTISGRIGEWLPLGGAEQSSRNRLSSLDGQRIETADEQRSLRIKIEIVAD